MAIMMAHVLLGEAWLIHLMKRVGPANPSNIISPGHQWASDLAANNRKTSFKSKLLPLWGEVYNCTFQGQDSHTDMSFSALFSIHFTLHISPQMLDHSWVRKPSWVPSIYPPQMIVWYGLIYVSDGISSLHLLKHAKIWRHADFSHVCGMWLCYHPIHSLIFWLFSYCRSSLSAFPIGFVCSTPCI